MSNYKVGIYIRVSTQEQANEGYSIDAQKDRLSCYCKSRDWDIYNIYIDGGFSGSNIKRPALTQLLSDIKEDKLNCVLVYKLDRLSRSQKDTLYIIEDVILKHNVDFVSLNENFDTSSPFGRAMIGILSVFAQLEREQIKERSMMGRIERAKNGLWHGGGYDPFGYKYIDGKLIIDEYEATIVKDIFNLFINKTAIHKISAIVLNKYNKQMHDTTIHSLLSTPLYSGLISYNGHTYQGIHTPIITSDIYDKAQNILEQRKRIYTHRPFESKTLLSGLLYCANCGAKYLSKGNYSGHGDKKRYRAYYTCYSRAKTKKNLIIDPNCKNPSYPVVKLDKIIINEIRKLFSSKEALFKTLAGSTPQGDSINQTTTALLHKIDSLDMQIEKLLDLYQIGGIDLEAIKDRIAKLTNEKQTIQRTIDKEKRAKKVKLTPHALLSYSNTYESLLKYGTQEEKRNLMHTLIQKIIVNREKDSFEILWNF